MRAPGEAAPGGRGGPAGSRASPGVRPAVTPGVPPRGRQAAQGTCRGQDARLARAGRRGAGSWAVRAPAAFSSPRAPLAGCASVAGRGLGGCAFRDRATRRPSAGMTVLAAPGPPPQPSATLSPKAAPRPGPLALPGRPPAPFLSADLGLSALWLVGHCMGDAPGPYYSKNLFGLVSVLPWA